MRLIVLVVVCLLASAPCVHAQNVPVNARSLAQVLSTLPTAEMARPPFIVLEQQKPARFPPLAKAVAAALVVSMAADVYTTLRTEKCCPACKENTPGVRAFRETFPGPAMYLAGGLVDLGLTYLGYKMGEHWNPAVRRVRYVPSIALSLGHVRAAIGNYRVC